MTRRRYPDSGDLLFGISLIALMILIGGEFVDGCLQSCDKRDCRQRGGQVDHVEGGEWRCVGAQPERVR